jgi:hypothetical protein
MSIVTKIQQNQIRNLAFFKNILQLSKILDQIRTNKSTQKIGLFITNLIHLKILI